MLLAGPFLSGCVEEGPETEKACIERFAKLGFDGNPPGNFQTEPIFTYDVSKMEDGFATIYGDASEMDGAKMTFVKGASGQALSQFYKADVPPKGAIFASDDVSLYRIKGAPGSREETLSAGCRNAPPNARLVHIQWIALPTKMEPNAQTH